MNGLGGMVENEVDVISEHSDEGEHVGCHWCKKPLHFAQVLAIQMKFKETFGK
jgi:hypothetical protein